MLGPLLLLQRLVHREIQMVFVLLARRIELGLWFYALLFFPGVLLHEISHYLMARLLGVRTGRFSVMPQLVQGDRLVFGYVEVASSSLLKDALIGVAPFLTGSLFVGYVGLVRLELTALWDSLAGGDGEAFFNAFSTLLAQPDFWLWFYLAFAVSSTMLPSPSDRRAWLPLGLIVLLLLGLALWAGVMPWLLEILGGPLSAALRSLAVVFAVTVGVHFALLLPLWLARLALSRLTGMQVAWR